MFPKTFSLDVLREMKDNLKSLLLTVFLSLFLCVLTPLSIHVLVTFHRDLLAITLRRTLLSLSLIRPAFRIPRHAEVLQLPRLN